MTDDLPFHYDPPPAEPDDRAPAKCRRHDWGKVDVIGHPGVVQFVCLRCAKTRDEAAVRRNRNNAKRGKRIQAQRIVALGGQNLPGNKPNHDGLGVLFSYESKSGRAFSERYWRWLRGIPANAQQSRVLIVTEAPGPGHKARSYVVVEFDEWEALHGETR